MTNCVLAYPHETIDDCDVCNRHVAVPASRGRKALKVLAWTLGITAAVAFAVVWIPIAIAGGFLYALSRG